MTASAQSMRVSEGHRTHFDDETQVGQGSGPVLSTALPHLQRDEAGDPCPEPGLRPIDANELLLCTPGGYSVGQWIRVKWGGGGFMRPF